MGQNENDSQTKPSLTRGFIKTTLSQSGPPWTTLSTKKYELLGFWTTSEMPISPTFFRVDHPTNPKVGHFLGRFWPLRALLNLLKTLSVSTFEVCTLIEDPPPVDTLQNRPVNWRR